MNGSTNRYFSSYLSICLSVYVYVCLSSICLWICLSICLSVHLSVYLSIHPSDYSCEKLYTLHFVPGAFQPFCVCRQPKNSSKAPRMIISRFTPCGCHTSAPVLFSISQAPGCWRVQPDEQNCVTTAQPCIPQQWQISTCWKPQDLNQFGVEVGSEHAALPLDSKNGIILHILHTVILYYIQLQNVAWPCILHIFSSIYILTLGVIKKDITGIYPI